MISLYHGLDGELYIRTDNVFSNPGLLLLTSIQQPSQWVHKDIKSLGNNRHNRLVSGNKQSDIILTELQTPTLSITKDIIFNSMTYIDNKKQIVTTK